MFIIIPVLNAPVILKEVQSFNSPTHIQCRESSILGIKVPEDTKYKAAKPAMSDQEFRNFLDSAGHMVKPEEFRISIYQGGCEPS